MTKKKSEDENSAKMRQLDAAVEKRDDVADENLGEEKTGSLMFFNGRAEGRVRCGRNGLGAALAVVCSYIILQC